MKKYISFALPKVIAGLLIGAVIFGLTYAVFNDRYEDSLSGGLTGLERQYKKILESYESGKTDAGFIGMICHFYSSDYAKFAKIEDDGTFTVIHETGYDYIPVEINLHEWVYVTKNEDLISGERSHFESDPDKKFNMRYDYMRCDEAWELRPYMDTRMASTFTITSMADGYYSNYDLYYRISELIGIVDFPYFQVGSYYIEDGTLHLGKVYQLTELMAGKRFGKQWDFTDPAKADLYLSDSDSVPEYVSSPMIMDYHAYPEAFFAEHGGMFLAKNVSEFNEACQNDPETDEFSGEYFRAMVYDENGHRSIGSRTVYEINGQKYLIEIVSTVKSFDEYYGHFLLCYGIVLFILCAGIALLSAIRPYRQYRKAYENNVYKNNLIDTLAHNMKTPLQILGGYAENLKDVNGDEKNHYADRILAKTAEMNRDIEAVLKTAEKTNPVLKKGSVKEVFEEAAKKAGVEPVISGDTSIKMDRDYFGQAVFCLLDNAGKYRSEDAKIEVNIGKKNITVRNKTSKDKFTSGTGLAIAGRIIEQHGLKLKTDIKDGVFTATIAKK